MLNIAIRLECERLMVNVQVSNFSNFDKKSQTKFINGLQEIANDISKTATIEQDRKMLRKLLSKK